MILGDREGGWVKRHREEGVGIWWSHGATLLLAPPLVDGGIKTKDSLGVKAESLDNIS